MPTPPPRPPAPPADPDLPLTVPPPAPRRKLSRRASLVGTVLALLVAAGLAWLAWDLTRPEQTASAQRPGAAGGRAGGGGARGATTVGFAVAEAADIPVNMEALGTVVPQATVRVRPQVGGVLTQVLFKEGQQVRKGQLLATIDPRPFEMALQQAIGQRMRDEAQLAAARVTLERFETLLRQDSIARQEVDTQRATVNQLAATVVSSKAAEGTARLNLAYTRIVAPIEGRVGLRPVDVGNQVSQSDANGVAIITKLTPIDVEFAVPQDNASWLQQNAGAFMEVKAFDRTRTTLLDTGVFGSLDNQVDTTTGTVRAKARFNNTRLQLFPSQFVNVQLQLRVIRNAVMVPVAAVRQSGSGEFVFVLMEDRTVKQRQVVRGQMVGDRVQVVSGLQLGERVITEGADRLREGSRVLLAGDPPGQGGARQRRNAASGPASSPRATGSRPAAAASDAFTGASAARAPERAASAAMGASGPAPEAGSRLDKLSPEERARRRAEFMKLTPEEREERRRQRREAAGNAAPGQ